MILTARHLFGSSDAPFLSEGITLLFLVLTTLFAILTGLVYRSHIFVAFSFAAAYIVPFLVGSSANSPYGLLLYTLVISLGGFALALWYDEMSIVKRLIRISVIAGSILAVISAFTVKVPLHFIAVILTIVTITVAAFFATIRRGNLREMLTVFISGFVGIFLALMIGSTLPVFALGSVSILASVLFAPVIFLVGMWYILRRLTIGSIRWLLFAPVIIFLAALFTPLGEYFFSAILICALLSFGAIILLLAHTFSAAFQSLFF